MKKEKIAKAIDYSKVPEDVFQKQWRELQLSINDIEVALRNLEAYITPLYKHALLGAEGQIARSISKLYGQSSRIFRFSAKKTDKLSKKTKHFKIAFHTTLKENQGVH